MDVNIHVALMPGMHVNIHSKVNVFRSLLTENLLASFTVTADTVTNNNERTLIAALQIAVPRDALLACAMRVSRIDADIITGCLRRCYDRVVAVLARDADRYVEKIGVTGLYDVETDLVEIVMDDGLNARIHKSGTSGYVSQIRHRDWKFHVLDCFVAETQTYADRLLPLALCNTLERALQHKLEGSKVVSKKPETGNPSKNVPSILYLITGSKANDAAAKKKLDDDAAAAV